MPLLRAHKPRHARPSKTAPVLAAGGMTATFSAALTSPAGAATDDDFARLRQCESGGNYATNTGNGYYGAYQFDQRTWHGLGYPGLPSSASPAAQDQAAHTLQAERGWQPWPSCARRLGLSDSGGRSDQPARASRGRVVVLAKANPTVVALPHFTGVMTTALANSQYENVRSWQQRMSRRGWDIAVDGRFGPQSAHVAARFAAEKKLATTPGTVDHELWTAAWQLPVT
ncbi:MAG: Transglycosylase-like domain protein [Frankiales bacterium]|nr:Transglycosylase-like domain protein [Frankiales bacterium]